MRVNSNNYVTVYRTLDLGAQGIVVPHVNTADEARAVVDAGKFHPLGSRGMYTSRQGHGVPDYLQRANDETLLVVLIEDIAAIGNLGEIVEVDDIDVFFVAPSDLAQSMGHLGRADHPEVQQVIDGAIAQIVAAGRTAGTVVSNATVESYIAKGVRFPHDELERLVGLGGAGLRPEGRRSAALEPSSLGVGTRWAENPSLPALECAPWQARRCARRCRLLRSR